MNFNMFDDMEGLVLRERENAPMMRRKSHSDESRPDDADGYNDVLRKMPLAMAYVPYQQWGEVYSVEDAFCAGTLYPELDLPFERGTGRK